jgi:hypothetical protein
MQQNIFLNLLMQKYDFKKSESTYFFALMFAEW